MTDKTDKTDGDGRPAPENTLEPYFCWFVFTKAGARQETGWTMPFYSFESACVSVYLVTQRDSRITEAYVLSPDRKKVLFGLAPGPIREALEKGGLTPDRIGFPGIR